MTWTSSANHKWKHSCCTHDALNDALADESITAIESDIVLSEKTGEPVMAHPPSTHSDLSFEQFMHRCITAQAIKHLKLDFKEQRVVRTCLELAQSYSDALETRGQCVWLNADILPGPGACSSAFDADKFVRDCTQFMPGGVLSLGWRVDLGVGCAYDDEHIAEMMGLLRRHSLVESKIVLAANLRLATLGGDALKRLLDDTNCEILLWTGTGEPAVYPEQVDFAIRALAQIEDTAKLGRIGFDVSATMKNTLRAVDLHENVASRSM